MAALADSAAVEAANDPTGDNAMTYHAIQFDWPWQRRMLVPIEPQPPIDSHHSDLVEIRRAVNELTTVTAAQNERINGQAKEIERSHELIKALQTVEAQLRGDLRQAQSQINALELQLIEERNARTLQAEQLGDVKRQLLMADGRLKKQRDDLTVQGQQIAVLEEERAQARNVAQVWQLRAESAEAELAQLKEKMHATTQ
jgi:chromosome segregation ATPase